MIHAEGNHKPGTEDVQTIVRSNGRDLASYEKFFGVELAREDELILDLGAGDTRFAEEVRSNPDYNARVISLDLDYANTPPENRTDAVAGSATELPFADDSFDRVVSSWMFLHLPREVAQKALGEALRVTKPGGKISITPAMPWAGRSVDMGSSRKFSRLGFPRTLEITKPDDYDGIDRDEREGALSQLSRHMTMSATLYRVSRRLMAATIQRAGTNRLTVSDAGRVLKGQRDDRNMDHVDRPAFQIIDKQSGEFRTPDGEIVDELWWDEAPEPDGRITSDKVGDLIHQIAEDDKQGCFLAAQLNAWILRGSLTRQEAEELQATVASDSRFERYWIDQSLWDRDFRAWNNRSGDTPYVVTEVLGKRMAMTVRKGDCPIEELHDALDKGYVAVVGDDQHSRTVFMPADQDQMFVFDPKYDETTGFYEPQELEQFHKPDGWHVLFI
jgi:ubiquinone/menaquinone biosynthesis C-methylase UbiE